MPESDPFAVSFLQFRGGTGLAASSRAVFHWHREHWYHKPLGLHLLNKSRSWRSPLESCDGARFRTLLLFVATCRYSGWDMPLSLRAEYLSHIEHDLQGQEKCPSGIDNLWCRYSQRKIRLVTFLPFEAYVDPVLFCFLSLQWRYQKCCLCGHQCYLFWSVGQSQPLRFSEAEHKSAEFCLVFHCHK